MKKYFAVFILFASVTSIKAQSQQAPTTVQEKDTQPVLKDTAFTDLGVKFGYPENYTISPVSSTASNMVFYNPDSSIILSVRTTGATFQTVSTGWSAKDKKARKDNWFKQVGKTPRSHALSKKPMYSSDYVYPFNYAGADFFWITLLTSKPGVGLAEMEAVKKSLALAEERVETREIIPGLATMEIPAYYQPEKTAKLSAFKAQARLLEVYTTGKKGTNSPKLASEDLKKTGLAYGFKLAGNINFTSASGIPFTGFYGRLNQKTGKYNEAHVFFENPASAKHECYGIRLRLLKGYSLNLGKDLEAMLATVKFM